MKPIDYLAGKTETKQSGQLDDLKNNMSNVFFHLESASSSLRKAEDTAFDVKTEKQITKIKKAVIKLTEDLSSIDIGQNKK